MPGGYADKAAVPKRPQRPPWILPLVPTRSPAPPLHLLLGMVRPRVAPPQRPRLPPRSSPKGVCALCAVDARTAYFDLQRSRGTHRIKLLARWGLKSIGRKSLWDADHVIPVVEGGGERDLQSLRTLCLIWHRQQTLELRRRRLSTKAAAARG